LIKKPLIFDHKTTRNGIKFDKKLQGRSIREEYRME